MSKTFVLDTNVLLHDSESISKFPRQKIVIPITVLEELDKMKRLPGELGKNARSVFRFLDSIKTGNNGNLHSGVKLENESIISILLETNYETKHLSLDNNDNKIILGALLLQETGHKVVFVSKDFAARIKAEALGLESQDYLNQKFSYEVIYKGFREVQAPKHDIDTFFKDGKISIELDDPKPNEYFVLKSLENSSAIAKYHPRDQVLQPILKYNNIWGISPKNIQQKCAIDLLLRDDIKLVTLIGPAGTGKTLLALACALKKTFDDGVYNKIMISRPIVPLGRDIGYLPGTKEEKLFNWMQPIYDNLEFLCASNGSDPSGTLDWIMNSKKIETEAVTYIRGRSLPKMFFIVDEAQNLTPHEIKTIISRAGEGTKVILTGDPEQIDNPYLDKDSNGLTYTIGKFSNEPLFGQMFLNKTERSELAAKAAQIL